MSGVTQALSVFPYRHISLLRPLGHGDLQIGPLMNLYCGGGSRVMVNTNRGSLFQCQGLIDLK